MPPNRNSSLWADLRAVVYLGIIYLLIPVWGLLFFIPSMLSYRMVLWTMKSYVVIAFFLLRVICGTRCELRGELPDGRCIVAAKHQSFLDVMMMMLWVPEPRFVMKRSVMYVPVLGLYAVRLGCIPIDRGKRGEAMRSIIQGSRKGRAATGQIIIFPQGTRTAPGSDLPYKGGVAKLYQETGLSLSLVAVNTGWFWPRTGLRRSPGLAVADFFGTIQAGRPTGEVFEELRDRIETRSDALAQEAKGYFR
jgi:1-acyl-sn-glycerol-3-phosphate acyltransferase